MRTSPTALMVAVAACCAALLGTLGGCSRNEPATAPEAADDSRGGGFTALHRAAEKGLTSSVRNLLERGEEVDARDESGLTPLHHAAREGEAEIAGMLLDAGADVDAQSDRGWVPLHMAAAMGEAEVAGVLLERAAVVDVRDKAGLTPLHQAAAEGEAAMVQVLLSHGADPQAEDVVGWRPLDHAAHEGHRDAVDVLSRLAPKQDAGRERVVRLREDAEETTALPERGAGGATANRGRPNVLLIVVDALRPDRLGCYGYGRGTSPTLDGLARAGALFVDAMAQGSETATTVPALLAGRRPGERGMEWVNRKKVFSVPGPECKPLAELLKEAGYATAAVSANPLVGPTMRADRGFDYFGLSPAQGAVWLRSSASDVNRAASEWLAAYDRADGPFFLYLHHLEPHNQYRPPSEFCLFGRPGYTPRDDHRNEAANRASDAHPGEAVTPETLAEQDLSPADIARLSDLYDAEVLCVDHAIGELLRRLADMGLYDDTLVIVTADHGEAFLEHGRLEHGESLQQELIRVPLIVAGPGVADGERLEDLVQHIDIAPTVLEAAGARPADMSGRSFYRALIGKGEVAEALGLAEMPHRGTRALRAGNLKLVVSPGQVELFDLSRDAAEAHDLAGKKRAEVARLTAALDDLLANRTPATIVAESADEEALEALKGLGYLK